MKTWTLLTPLTVVLMLTATPVLAQTGGTSIAPPTLSNDGGRAEPRPSPSSTQTGETTSPSLVDPAQAHKTGGNAGDGASYSRSNDKGQPTVKDADKKK